MKCLIVIAVVVLVSTGAAAQSTQPVPPPQSPPPQQPSPQVQTPGILNTVFSELEKNIIQEVLGAATNSDPAKPTDVGGSVERVIRKTIDSTVGSTASPASTSSTEKDDDAEEKDREDGSAHQARGRGKNKQKGKNKGRGKGKGRNMGLPPGLAKRDKLPPGLQKQLERNGKLPPGLQKKAFPEDLKAKLPPPQPGTERAIVGNDAVLIDTATNVVLDVLRGVLNKGK